MSKRQRTRQLLEEHGLLRAEELEEHGISPSYVAKLAERGAIQRLTRGVYASPEHTPTEHHDLAIVQKRVPHAVFCLRTALQFHNLTTQSPGAVEIAIRRGKDPPSFDWPPLEVHHISDSQFDAGIETHDLREGPTIRVYSPARTVADCFKFRNRIGKDVALEALEDCLKQDMCTVDELTHFADICRVKTVIRPYLEALV
jgi:predicted transcriptional regulator of viral defense system